MTGPTKAHAPSRPAAVAAGTDNTRTPGAATPQATGRARRRRTPRGHGPLVVLTVLLMASAAIRVGLVTDARAREPQAAAPLQSAATAPEASALLAALQAREERLKAAEGSLAERRAAQEVMENALDRKLAELTTAEQALSATIARAQTAAEDDLARLTTVYENMKPANAAALFEAMAPDFAAGFLARMRPEAAAGIMAGLTPQAAYSISALLAGRNARVPTE